MAKDFNKISKDIVEKVGGADNIEKVMHCMTRLRLVLRDEGKANLDGLKQVEGVINVTVAAGQYQVVYGTSVPKLYDAVVKNYGLESRAGGTVGEDQAEAGGTKKKVNLFNMLIDTIAGVFLPIIPALGAVGILKGILVACTTLGVLSDQSDTYRVLYALAQGFFYYLPLALSISAAEKFKGNKFVVLSVVMAMIYPDMIPAMFEHPVLKLFGFVPLTMIDYTSTVIPAIVVAWFTSRLESLIHKWMPDVVDMILTPLVTIFVALPVSMMIIGPATYYLGVWMANVYQYVFGLAPVVAGGVLGALWPIAIVFDLHWGFIPIAIQQISTLGGDSFSPITVACNFATMGACVAVFLKTKNVKVKEVAGSAAFSAILGGITEPGVYGVTLKYKKPFVACCIFTGIAGVIMSFSATAWPGIMTVSFLTLPALSLLPGGMFTLVAALLGFFGTAIATYLFGFDDSMVEES